MTNFPSSFLARGDDIAGARQAFKDKRAAFQEERTSPDAIQLTQDEAIAAYRAAMFPPKEVTENWMLLMCWAFWYLYSEFPIPMILGIAFSALYFTATFYYELVRPILLIFIGS